MFKRNEIIRNPFAFANRCAERAERRKRPEYPSVATGQSLLVARKSCGVTRRFLPVDLKTGLSPTQRLLGKFVFKREATKPSASRYVPHVGKKQSAR